MPIKTTVAVQADEAGFKKSYAAFEKYRAALKETHGVYVLQAPHIRAASAVGDDLAKFVNGIDHAARSQTRFATAADKAHHAFRGLAGGVTRTLEGFARVALSPLQMLFPAGLSVGLFGLGAGLVGAGVAGATLYGLDRAASGVSDRRRRALGLGVDYGAPTAFDLNFARFGAEGGLEAVAAGAYDVTSPAFLGLLSSGAARGSVDESAIALMRNIPKIFAGYSDGAVGPVARSHGLDSLLDLQTIVRLKNHPEEIEAQIARYRLDRKSFDISKDAQQKWASFDTALSRAGQKIESALGRNLVALTPGLIKFSDDIKNFIDALVDSGAVTDALKGIQGGLQWFERCVGSSSFKRDSGAFLEGLDKLGTVAGPALLTLMQIEGALGLVGLGGLSKALKRVTINGATFWVIGKFAEDALTGKLFEPTTGANRRLAQDLGLEPRGDSSYAPGRRSDGLGGSSIRYYAGRGKEPPPYGGVIEQPSGRLLPRPSFRYSPGYSPATQSPSPVTTEDGGVVLPAVTDQNRAYRNTGTITIPGEDGKLHTYTFVTGGGGRGSAPTGDYDVGEFATGGRIGDRWTITEVGQPHDTAFDPVLNAERSALRIHMAHGDRTLGCIGILGGDRVFADFEHNLMYVIKKNGGHVRLRLGSPDAASITKRMTKTPNGAGAVKNGALPSRPVSPTPRGDSLGHDDPHHGLGTSDPVNPTFFRSWEKGLFREGIFAPEHGAGAPMPLPGAMPHMAVGEHLHYANNVGLSNMALRKRGRALHILDHMDVRPPRQLIIDNQSGDSVQVTVSRHMAAQ